MCSELIQNSEVQKKNFEDGFSLAHEKSVNTIDM